MPVQGPDQDEAAFDEPDPLDDEDDEPDDDELDEDELDEDEDDPESLDDEPEDDEPEPDDDSDVPAFTVLLVDVLRESVR